MHKRMLRGEYVACAHLKFGVKESGRDKADRNTRGGHKKSTTCAKNLAGQGHQKKKIGIPEQGRKVRKNNKLWRRGKNRQGARRREIGLVFKWKKGRGDQKGLRRENWLEKTSAKKNENEKRKRERFPPFGAVYFIKS